MRLVLLLLAIGCFSISGLFAYRHYNTPIQVLYSEYSKNVDPLTREFDGTLQWDVWHNTGRYIEGPTIINVRTFPERYPEPFTLKIGNESIDARFRERDNVQQYETTILVLRNVGDTKTAMQVSKNIEHTVVIEKETPLLVRANRATMDNPVKLQFRIKKMNAAEKTQSGEQLNPANKSKRTEIRVLRTR